MVSKSNTTNEYYPANVANSTLYVGDSSNIAQKIKTLYIGQNSIATKIKKLYVGDENGVAKLCYKLPDTVAFGGTLPPAYLGGSYPTIAANDKYVIINSSVWIDQQIKNYAFNASFVQTPIESLSSRRVGCGSGKIGGYALFAGGGSDHDTDYMKASTDIDIYNNSLTHTTASLSAASYDLPSANVGNYLIFNGGKYRYQDDGYSIGVNAWDAFTSSLTRTSGTGGNYYYEGSSGWNPNYAIFAGGYQDNGQYVTGSGQAFNSSLTKTSVSILAGRDRSGGGIGNYAIFTGFVAGNIDASDNDLDAIDTSLTRTVHDNLLPYFGQSAGPIRNLGDYAIIYTPYSNTGTAILINKSLTVTTVNIGFPGPYLAYHTRNGAVSFNNTIVYSDRPSFGNTAQPMYLTLI
jgi:hypothetical protein